ncbi:MAG: phosphoribosyltransferase family protein [Pseudomonadota bacterium]
MDKRYISPQQLLTDAYALGVEIVNSGFKPDYLIGIWRGGTPVAIAIHELMDVLGIKTDHFAIRTQSYEAMGRRGNSVGVEGLSYLQTRAKAGDSVLLVDDVYDTGLSAQQVVTDLRHLYAGKPADIRIATPYYKPKNNLTGREPNFFLKTTDQWLVFPHEIEGLSLQDIRDHKPELDAALPLLARHFGKGRH